MHSGEHRCLHQPRIGERHEVVMAMDQIKFSGMFEGFRDVEIFGDLGIRIGILFVTLLDYAMQIRFGDGIFRREQSDVPTTGDKSFGDIAGNRLPSAILPRRSAPGGR